jgi:hypothetical protein
VTLSATSAGGGALEWFDISGNSVGTGSTFSTSITDTSTFYAVEEFANTPVHCGSPDSAMGGGSLFIATNAHGLYFDVLTPCTIVSVNSYAGSAGPRTIQVLDDNGILINTQVVTLTTGLNTIPLNIHMDAGKGYFIKVADGSTLNLYRNSANAAYPYSNNVISITGNDANPLYYYFFYDWVVTQDPCMSPSATIMGIDTCDAIGIDEISGIQHLQLFPNPGNGIFTIKFNTILKGECILKVSDVTGKIVYERLDKNLKSDYSTTVDISTLGKGVYNISILVGEERMTRVMVIE